MASIKGLRLTKQLKDHTCIHVLKDLRDELPHHPVVDIGYFEGQQSLKARIISQKTLIQCMPNQGLAVKSSCGLKVWMIVIMRVIKNPKRKVKSPWGHVNGKKRMMLM